MFFIARNSLAVTGPMTKKAALALWEDHRHSVIGDAKFTLCKETGNMAEFKPVMNLN